VSLHLRWNLAPLCPVFVLVAFSGSGAPSSRQAPPTVARPAVESTGAGNVTGRITFAGAPYQNDPIRMNADPACLREAKGPQWQETIAVGEGSGLQNVFVYVKDGLGNRQFPVPTTAITLDQNGCRYSPHVFGVRVGQRVQVVNSDPTLHNIHVIPHHNTKFNVSQPVKGMKYEHVFTKPEVMVPFRCDVHGWMNAYAGVVDHPYFAVTGANGAFELKALPPGQYTIEAWHEKLGTQTQTVSLGPNETKSLAISFKISSVP
jgi:plastocyanin